MNSMGPWRSPVSFKLTPSVSFTHCTVTQTTALESFLIVSFTGTSSSSLSRGGIGTGYRVPRRRGIKTSTRTCVSAVSSLPYRLCGAHESPKWEAGRRTRLPNQQGIGEELETLHRGNTTQGVSLGAAAPGTSRARGRASGWRMAWNWVS